MATARKSIAKNQLEEPAGATLLVIKEGTLIGVLVVATFCLLALLTYDAQDPGWSAVAEHSGVANAMGKTGAWVADLLFSLFGFSAYIIPSMLLYRSWLIFRDRYAPMQLDAITVAMKLVGALLLMLGLTCLFALSSLPDHTALPFGGGGYIGMSLSVGLHGLLNASGTSLLMLALTLFGLTLFAEVSWLALMDKLGAWTLRLGQVAYEHLVDWFERSREIARERLRERAAAQEDKNEPEQATLFKGSSARSAGDGAAPAQPQEASSDINVLDRVKQGVSAVLPGMAAEKEAPAKSLVAKPVAYARTSAAMGNVQIPEFKLLDTPATDRETGYSEDEL